MTPKGTPFFWLEGGRLRNRMLFERRGSRLIRVRVITHGPVHLKPTHWHSNAANRFGRPSVMSAAYGVEIEKALTRLGAR